MNGMNTMTNGMQQMKQLCLAQNKHFILGFESCLVFFWQKGHRSLIKAPTFNGQTNMPHSSEVHKSDLVSQITTQWAAIHG